MPMVGSSKWEAWKADDTALDDLCTRIEGGESLTAIAQSLDVHVANLTRWIAAETQRSARAREARIASAAIFDEMALAELRLAADPFELSRAKEVAHHLRWKASKTNPREYGDKVAVGGDADAPAIRFEKVVRTIVDPAT